MTKISPQSVVRESHYYQEIRASVESASDQDFHLLLAMVCQDATQLDEFHQYRSEVLEDVADLESNFHIQNKNLIGSFNPVVEAYNTAAANAESVSTVHLNNCLNPPPLVSDVYDLPADVFDNMDMNQRNLLLMREREKDQANNEDAEAPKTSESTFDSAAWFNVLQQARTLSQLA